MAWTVPRTWIVGETVAAAQLNTHLRDELLDLDSRVTAAGARPLLKNGALVATRRGLNLIEGTGMTISVVDDGVNDRANVTLTAAVAGVPSGIVLPYIGASAPSGFLVLDGSAVSRTTYASLFGIAGTTFGAGDGSTTFNLPNVKSRTIVGLDSGATEFNARGKTGGEKTHVLTLAELASHTHTVAHDPHAHVPFDDGTNFVTNNGSRGAYTAGPSGGFTGATSVNSPGLSINPAGSGGGHNNLQPYMSLLYIVKT